MNNRQILNDLIKKFEIAEATKSKELRIALADVHKYHLALIKLLLENTEKQVAPDSPVKKTETTEIVADGGSFSS